MTAKRKIFLVITLIVIAAVLVVIFVNYFTAGHSSEYDGTLVRLSFDFPRFI